MRFINIKSTILGVKATKAQGKFTSCFKIETIKWEMNAKNHPPLVTTLPPRAMRPQHQGEVYRNIKSTIFSVKAQDIILKVSWNWSINYALTVLVTTPPPPATPRPPMVTGGVCQLVSPPLTMNTPGGAIRGLVPGTLSKRRIRRRTVSNNSLISLFTVTISN